MIINCLNKTEKFRIIAVTREGGKKVISKRTMRLLGKVTNKTPVTKTVLDQGPGRRYMGRFLGGHLHKNSEKADGSPIEKHLMTHGVIVDTALPDSPLVGNETSCKKSYTQKVACEKINGDYFEKKTGLSGKPIVNNFGEEEKIIVHPIKTLADDYGKTVADPNKGGQFLVIFNIQRVLDPGTFIEDPKRTQYWETHETKAAEIFDNAPNYYNRPKERIVLNQNNNENDEN